MGLTQITYLQMMETLEDTLSAMEDNMSLRLNKIEHRLDSLQKVVSCCSFIASGAPNSSFLSDPLKRNFWLSGVPLKLCRFISLRPPYNIFICSVILGELESFQNY